MEQLENVRRIIRQYGEAERRLAFNINGYSVVPSLPFLPESIKIGGYKEKDGKLYIRISKTECIALK